MSGLNGLTAVQLSEDVDARPIVDVACRRGPVLEDMAGTNDLAMGVAPGMVLHSIQALHAECQMGSVRTVALRAPELLHFRGSKLRCPQ